MIRFRSTALAVTQLEDRLVPAINILFDFRYDLGFFTNHPDRISTLRAAALNVGSRFTDTLAAIPFRITPEGELEVGE